MMNTPQLTIFGVFNRSVSNEKRIEQIYLLTQLELISLNDKYNIMPIRI